MLSLRRANVAKSQSGPKNCKTSCLKFLQQFNLTRTWLKRGKIQLESRKTDNRNHETNLS